MCTDDSSRKSKYALKTTAQSTPFMCSWCFRIECAMCNQISSVPSENSHHGLNIHSSDRFTSERRGCSRIARNSKRGIENVNVCACYFFKCLYLHQGFIQLFISNRLIHHKLRSKFYNSLHVTFVQIAGLAFILRFANSMVNGTAGSC